MRFAIASFHSIKICIALYLLSSFATTMDKLDNNSFDNTPKEQGIEKVRDTYQSKSNDENLNNLEVIRASVGEDIKELKMQLETTPESSQSKKIRQELKLYEKASQIIDKARKLYISYSCDILRAVRHEKSSTGFAFMRYVKLLACSNELELLTERGKSHLFHSRIKLFQDAISLIKDSLPFQEKYWTDFLNIYGPDDIRLSAVQMAHQQAKEFKNIYNIISKIDLDKFSFVKGSYKKFLIDHLAKMKEDAAWALNQKNFLLHT